MREEFLISRQGKTYALYAGLLAEAHERGLEGIWTDLIQAPGPGNDNVAIVKARVKMADEKMFEGYGDASPPNVGKMIQPHLLRMAETRAKARALRDAINVGVTAFEELGGDDAPDAPQGRETQASARSGQADDQERTPGGATVKAADYLRDLRRKQGLVLDGIDQMSRGAVKAEIEELRS